MARQKKDAKAATFYLSTESIEKLEKYCTITGVPKTVAVERFIIKYVNEFEKETGSDNSRKQ